MPSYKLAGQEISPKTLAHSVARSAKIARYHAAAFHAEALPRIRKLSLATYREAFASSGELRCKLTKSFLDLVEMRRVLLGFPSPGRRESAMATATQHQPAVMDVESTAPNAQSKPD